MCLTSFGIQVCLARYGAAARGARWSPVARAPSQPSRAAPCRPAPLQTRSPQPPTPGPRPAQASDIKKLKDVGIHTVEALQNISRRKLVQIKGISDAKADKIRDASCNIKKKLCFQSAKELQISRDRKVP